MLRRSARAVGGLTDGERFGLCRGGRQLGARDPHSPSCRAALSDSLRRCNWFMHDTLTCGPS